MIGPLTGAVAADIVEELLVFTAGGDVSELFLCLFSFRDAYD